MAPPGVSALSGDRCAPGDKKARKTRKTRQKKKHTYTVRAEKKVALLEELRRLELEVEALKQEKSSRMKGSAIGHIDGRNGGLRSAVVAQELAIAGVQSAVSASIVRQPGVPFQPKIQLGRDVDERRNMLARLKPSVLSTARAFLAERTRFTDFGVPFAEQAQYVDSDGVHCLARFEVIPLPSAASVRQVFDAMTFTFFNLELHISEKIGEITLRDEDDALAALGINQSRFLSYLDSCRDEHGAPVEMEKNAITFSEFNERDHGFADDCPAGIIVTTTAQSDELFPYNPSRRIRKDFSCCWGVRPLSRDLKGTKGVVMVCASKLKLWRPRGLVVVGRTMEDLEESHRRWSRVIVDAVCELVKH